MENMMSTVTKKTVRTGACNSVSTPWLAMIGCEGRGTFYRYGIEHFGRREMIFACKVCRSFDRMQSAIYRGSSPIVGHPTGHPGQQKNLLDIQKSAGVLDYRTATVKKIGGRWKITHPGYGRK